MVIAAVADRVVSDTEVAMSVTETFAGTVGGGVYVTDDPLGVFDGVTDPHAGVHGVPLCIKDHITPALLPSYCTVAVKL